MLDSGLINPENDKMSPKGPYRLVTVNTVPERAKRLVGRVVEELKDRYTIQHLANCESKRLPTSGSALSEISGLIYGVTGIDEVEGKVRELQPNLLVRSFPAFSPS